MHMRSCNMAARNRTMESGSEEHDFEPLSKRSRLILDEQEASSSSKLSNESLDAGKYFRKNSYLPIYLSTRNASYHCKMAEKNTWYWGVMQEAVLWLKEKFAG